MSCKYESDEQNVILAICLSVCSVSRLYLEFCLTFVSGLNVERHYYRWADLECRDGGRSHRHYSQVVTAVDSNVFAINSSSRAQVRILLVSVLVQKATFFLVLGVSSDGNLAARINFIYLGDVLVACGSFLTQSSSGLIHHWSCICTRDV